ncbi:MOT2 transcriptional repressor [Spraguea lophii 42_110]|uniref:MOT2 transcriptional repressor n=1 Tax=Spraguea lophii (strain 42_110) TaxID=1358809 RepID=S7W5L2_SPRLO|nr:MOT2 transcriptional repressor [Spraguea lophii 42_110]
MSNIFNTIETRDMSEHDKSGLRVIQKNLVYVIGIPYKYGCEELLKNNDFFGQFGHIKKLVLKNRSSENSISCYITYATEKDAVYCISEVDESLLDGRIIKCTFGTTKYCSFFLKNQLCQNTDCMYLHENGKEKDSLTKEEMAMGKSKLHNFKIINKNKERIGKNNNMYKNIKSLFVYKDNEVYTPPRKIYFNLDDL